MTLAVVRDLREARAPAGPEELAAFETDALAGFVLARAAAGLADSTLAGEVIHLEQIRLWLGQPLWAMRPADADVYFGQVLRGAAKGTRLARAQALKTYFLFLELRHKVEISQLTGHIVECPVDEINRPRGSRDAALRIPPAETQIGMLFAGWRGELAGCRKFAPAARNYTAAKLMAEVGLRVNEVCQLDLADVKWELGRFGKIHVPWARAPAGPAPASAWSRSSTTRGRPWSGSCRMCGGTSTTTTPGPGRRCCPPSGRTATGPVPGSGMRRYGPRLPVPPRFTCQTGRAGSPRTCCGIFAPASCMHTEWTWSPSRRSLVRHSWIVTTMNYIHVHRTHVEDAWIAGQQRAAEKLKGLSS